jgi:hypothetical protein
MTDTVFIATLDREVRTPSDGATVHHRIGVWSNTYSRVELTMKLAFYERMAQAHDKPGYKADMDVLRQACEFLNER